MWVGLNKAHNGAGEPRFAKEGIARQSQAGSDMVWIDRPRGNGKSLKVVAGRAPGMGFVSGQGKGKWAWGTLSGKYRRNQLAVGLKGG